MVNLNLDYFTSYIFCLYEICVIIYFIMSFLIHFNIDNFEPP